jgi:hypothetical protein
LPCCVLHRIVLPVVSEWYQLKPVDSGLSVAGSFASQIRQILGGPPNRRGEAPRRDFNLPGPVGPGLYTIRHLDFGEHEFSELG